MNNWDDAGLDRLYRDTPRGVTRTHREIAKAAGVRYQTIYFYEQRALQKIARELARRGITEEAVTIR